MIDHKAAVTEKLAAFLTRKNVPRHLAGKHELIGAEMDSLTKIVLRYAPTQGLEEWWDAFEEHLLRRMKTQAWPIASEVEAACQMASPTRTTDAGEAMVEAKTLEMMTNWFIKFRTQMPNCGKAERTAELIRRGVLADEREARFFGFTLSQDQNQIALKQRPRKDEWDPHIRVMARLKNQSLEETEWQERAALSPDQLPAPRQMPEAI